MVAILKSLVVILLCTRIPVIVSENCRCPNEKFRNDSCEIYCVRYQPSPCMGQRSSRCFCNYGTVRNSQNLLSKSGPCITFDECAEKICDANQTFNEYFELEEVCSCNGIINLNRVIGLIRTCKCRNGFIRYIDWRGECITRSECKQKKTNPTCY